MASSTKTFAFTLCRGSRHGRWWCGSTIGYSARRWDRWTTTPRAFSVQSLSGSQKTLVLPHVDPSITFSEAIWNEGYSSDAPSQMNARSLIGASKRRVNPFQKQLAMGRSHYEAFVCTQQIVNLTMGRWTEVNSDGGTTGEEDRDHYHMASDLIQFFLHEPAMCASNPRAITATLVLLERLLREMVYTNTRSKHVPYLFQDEHDFYTLMNFWKDAALADEPVLPAREMLTKVQWFLSVVPDHPLLRLDYRIVLLFMQVMMQQNTKCQVPLVIERLLAFAQNTMKETKAKYWVEPDLSIYQLVLRAWMESESPQASKKLEDVLMEMRKREIALNWECYAMLIPFWAQQGNLVQAKSFLDAMRVQRLEPDLECYGHLLLGFARVRQPLSAIGYLEKMYRKSIGTPDHARWITTGVLHILLAFHELILADQDVARNVTRAEDVVRKYEAHTNACSMEQDDRVYSGMMSMYAQAGCPEQAETMMNKVDSKDPSKYTMLVQAYGKMGRADEAVDLVFSRMPQDPKVVPVPHVYEALIVAWAVSDREDAIKQAYAVIESMDDSELCKQHNLRPDNSIFVALFNCIGVSHCHDPGPLVLAILDDIEHRSHENSMLHLNQEIYDAALNVCLQRKLPDWQSSEAILRRFETSEPPPDMSFYNDLLNRFATVRTLGAADFVENVLMRLNELSKSNAQLKPNADNYNDVISCWIATDANTSSKRAWILYEKMEYGYVLPTMRTFTIMIGYLAKSMWGKVDVRRAERLLSLMERGEMVGIAPDRRHYGPVMNGWIALGDIQNATDVLLRRIKTYLGSTGRMKDACTPTPDNFYVVISGWIAIDELVKATEFAEQMQALRDNQEIPDGPDVYSYLELHSAWTHSESPDAAQYIETLDATIARLGLLPKKQGKPIRREPESTADSDLLQYRYINDN